MKNPWLEQLGISSQKERAIIADHTLFGLDYLASISGRPDFRREVRRGDEAAVSYWIGRYPDLLPNKDMPHTAYYFDYLSDLSTNEDRAGGFNGLQGPDADVQRLRRCLFGKLRTFAPPSMDSEKLEITPEKYIEVFERLFTRAVGMKAADELLDKLGNTPNQDPRYNPYLMLSPDVRWQHMQKCMLQELRNDATSL